MANLAQQLSDQLVNVTEQRDQLYAEREQLRADLSATKAQVVTLQSEVNEHKLAQQVRQSSGALAKVQSPSRNATGLFGNTAKANSAETESSRPTPTPEYN